MLIGSTVAATIICADIIEGSWPDDSRGCVVSRIAPFDRDFVLLDSGEGLLQVDPGGRIILQRGIVLFLGSITISPLPLAALVSSVWRARLVSDQTISFGVHAQDPPWLLLCCGEVRALGVVSVHLCLMMM